MMTILECENCNHKFPSNDVELTNVEITDEFFNIYWNCPKCNFKVAAGAYDINIEKLQS